MKVRNTWTITAGTLLALTVGCGKSLESSLGGQTLARNAVPVAVGAPELSRPSALLSPPQPMPLRSAAPEEDPASRESADTVVPLQIARVDPQATHRRLDELSGSRESGLKDVYFAFDSWTIPAEAREALVADAQWLQAHPADSATIEGHCDERGTLAYNLVLGEKRARAVKAYLTDLGIAPETLRVVSYGKERPVCLESDETCYQKNRRGHIATTTTARAE